MMLGPLDDRVARWLTRSAAVRRIQRDPQRGARHGNTVQCLVRQSIVKRPGFITAVVPYIEFAQIALRPENGKLRIQALDSIEQLGNCQFRRVKIHVPSLECRIPKTVFGVANVQCAYIAGGKFSRQRFKVEGSDKVQVRVEIENLQHLSPRIDAKLFSIQLRLESP